MGFAVVYGSGSGRSNVRVVSRARADRSTLYGSSGLFARANGIRVRNAVRRRRVLEPRSICRFLAKRSSTLFFRRRVRRLGLDLNGEGDFTVGTGHFPVGVRRRPLVTGRLEFVDAAVLFYNATRCNAGTCRRLASKR